MKTINQFLGTMKSPDTLFQHVVRVALGAAFIMVVPLLAMLFGDEMNWSPADFVLAWSMLFGAGVTYQLIARRMGHPGYRAAVGVAVGTGLFLLWSNLAVGLIGNEDNPANLMYLGVFSVAIIGALLARFQPRGMVRTLLATALAQALVTAIALITGQQNAPESSVTEILTVNWFFILLWVVSALLFRNAAQDHAPKDI